MTPSAAGWLSGRNPLACSVETKGIPWVSTNRSNDEAARLRVKVSPVTMRGRRADFSKSRTRLPIALSLRRPCIGYRKGRRILRRGAFSYILGKIEMHRPGRFGNRQCKRPGQFLGDTTLLQSP